MTTDDCYTPPEVYEAVAGWVGNTYNVDREQFIRPFYPGGDYENHQYKDGDIVVDNPPFSIISEIVHNYTRKGIKFFLFSPGLTGISKGIENRPVTILATGARIVYENGAVVNTSFVTNLETKYIVRSAPDLRKIVEIASAEARAKSVKTVPKYKYPPHVVTLAQVNYFSQHGIMFGVKRGEAIWIGHMDEQKQAGKTCFGGGLLVSEKAAAEKEAAEKEAAEKANAIQWTLSEREWIIVRNISAKDKDG